MKSSNYLLFVAFCWMLATPSSASAWSFYTQDSQQTTPTPPQQNQTTKQQGKKNSPTNANQSASGQPTSTTGSQPTNAPNNAPKPLFGGQVNLKSSRQSKDTATLGFNGLDPNGQVQKGFLAAAPTAADVVKAQQLTQTGVTQADVTAFMQEGGLNAPGGQQ